MLAFVATPCPFASISLHGRPEIALLKRFEREGNSSGMVSTDALMYLAEDLGRLDAIEASE